MGADRLTEPDRTARRGGFGGDAQRYDRVRPGYPGAMFDAVAEHGGHGPGTRVLEIAPGTGQATVQMVDRGWIVRAVELDPGMAAVLRKRLGDRVEVVVGAFEEQPPPARPVDLVLCATAFHWLDPAVRLRRIHDALRGGGTAAVVWTRHVRGGTQAFFDAAQPCYDRWSPDDPSTGLLPEHEVQPRTDEFARSELFTDVASARFVSEIEYLTADYLDLLRTYSDTIALPDDRRKGLLACIGERLDRDFGGRAVKRYCFDLVLARRV